MAKKQQKQQLPAKGRSKGKGSRYDRFVLAGIVITLVAIVLVLWGPLRKFRPFEPKKAAEQAQKKQGPEQPEKRTGKKERAPDREPKKHEEKMAGRTGPGALLVAIVIDDLGQDMKYAQDLIALPYRITFAVMPGLPQTRKVSDLAKQNNREVLLHLPMEYHSRNGKPARGMLRSDMTPMDFLNTLTEDLVSVPGAIGVNNHEGSSLTENKEAMKFLMAELKARNLYFLDSMTSPKSIAFGTAREFGIKTAKRDVFLDNDSDHPEAIRKQLDELERIAKDHGRAIGIGHPHATTIAELRKWLPSAEKQGISIVPVSKLIN